LRLRMSKSTFKMAVGKLYKQRKVEITPRGIKLLR
jgi:predicted RNA-binding protein (virulence factor B family)